MPVFLSLQAHSHHLPSIGLHRWSHFKTPDQWWLWICWQCWVHSVKMTGCMHRSLWADEIKLDELKVCLWLLTQKGRHSL